MKAGLQADDDADAARCGLKVQRQTLRHGGFDPCLHRQVLLAARVALQPGHGQGPAAGTGQLLHQIKFGVKAPGALHQVEVAHHLHHAMLAPGKGLGQATQFGRAGNRGRRVVPLCGAVVV